MTFYIKQNSVLPTLRMELIDDGRHTFRSFNESIQNAAVKFSMVNADTGTKKISNAECYIQKRDIDSCEDQYVICYDWKARDTKDPGTYVGTFTIDFGQITSEDGTLYPTGKLMMPIREDLYVTVLP